MKIDWVISKDGNKAILNNGDLEVHIKEFDFEKEQPTSQKISNKFETMCGFIKIETNRAFDCIIIKNNIKNMLDELDIETASRLIPKLFSTLGDKYIIDFVNKTGKKVGEIQNTKLGKYLDYSEGGLRGLEEKYPKRYEALYLGSFCKANNITKNDLVKLLENRE